MQQMSYSGMDRPEGVGGAGGGVENKLKNEVKFQNFPQKVTIKPKFCACGELRSTLVKQDQLNIYILI